MNLKYSILTGLAICRLSADAEIPLPGGPFVAFTRTDAELSIVCSNEHVPEGAKVDSGWVALKLHGPFPLTQTGVLAAFINPLADVGIPIFAISTFDTDYVLIKEEFWGAAMQALDTAGHEII